MRNGLLIGCLGGFTTFSTFSNDTLQLLLADEYVKAIAYVLLSVTTCIVFAGIGWYLAKQ